MLVQLLVAMPALGNRARWVLLALLTVIVAGLTVWVALRGTQLGPATSAVLQVASLVLSVYGGVVFAHQANDQTVRNAARASVRRVLVNFEMLGNLGEAISYLKSRLESGQGDGFIPSDLVDLGLKGLQDQVFLQISSADAAVQDWRDLAPAEVDEEVRRIRERES